MKMNSPTLDCLDCGGAGHDDLEGTACETCRGTGGVLCDGCMDGETLATGIDRSMPADPVALCSDCQAVPVGEIEAETTPVPNRSMADLVFGGAR